MSALEALAQDIWLIGKNMCDAEKREKIYRARLIIAELAKVETPIERSEVKSGAVGMAHLSDMIKADTKRALEVVRNCRIIAAEGADNGKR